MKLATMKLADELVLAINEHISKRLAPLEEALRGMTQRCDAQAARIEQLEQQLAEKSPPALREAA